MKKTEANTTEKRARRRWTRRDWDTLLQLLRFLASLYALYRVHS